MPRVQVITTNFTAGEFSPRMRGRVDLDRYNASAEKLHNVVVLRQGGVTIRPSLDFVGEVKASANLARLVAFIYSRDDAFILEFGNLYLRIWTAAGLPVESSPGVPVELVTPYTSAQLSAIDFTQGGDTLLMFHLDVQPQRLRRFSTAAWLLDAVPFDPPPLYEFGYASTTTVLTLSAATVGAGRTITASAADFRQADVGRSLISGSGLIKITAYTSDTLVTGTIVTAFASVTLAASAWRLLGTPQAQLTASAATPVGAAITLDCVVGLAGWRPGDETGFVEVNGGLVRLTSLASSIRANGVIERELTGITAAPADAWVLKNTAFNVFDGYPRTGTLLQQRLWLGGTKAHPLSIWGSRPGLAFDYLPGTQDDSGVYKTVDSDENNVIQYLASGWGSLLVLTFGNEFDMRGGIEKPITQSNAQITKRSRWGAAAVRPEELGSDMAFVMRNARAVRVMQKSDIEGFSSSDVSVFSEHLLADGIVSLSYEQSPESVLWHATATGALLALTYQREQETAAYAGGSTDGAVEWLATVPAGAVDATFALVRRTILGVTRRYIERLNWSAPAGQDSRKQVTGPAATVWAGFSHLDGKTVTVLADGIHVGTAVVSAGSITLPRAATLVSAGLPFTATVKLPAPEVGTGTGTAQGQAMSTHEVAVRFLSTAGCNVNGQPVSFQQFDGPLLDAAPALFTGIKRIGEGGWELGESPVELTQSLPYAFTVLSVIRGFTVNAG